MKKILLLLITPFFTFAALAPLPQSLREIEAILTYPALSDFLPQSSSINEITKISDGYLIITDSHILKVTIVMDKQKRIGPKKFSLKFGKAIPLKE
jgi:hypothetical protein